MPPQHSSLDHWNNKKCQEKNTKKSFWRCGCVFGVRLSNTSKEKIHTTALGINQVTAAWYTYVLRTLQRERDKLRGENRHLRAKKKGKMVMRDVDWSTRNTRKCHQQKNCYICSRKKKEIWYPVSTWSGGAQHNGWWWTFLKTILITSKRWGRVFKLVTHVDRQVDEEEKTSYATTHQCVSLSPLRRGPNREWNGVKK